MFTYFKNIYTIIKGNCITDIFWVYLSLSLSFGSFTLLLYKTDEKLLCNIPIYIYQHYHNIHSPFYHIFIYYFFPFSFLSRLILLTNHIIQKSVLSYINHCYLYFLLFFNIITTPILLLSPFLYYFSFLSFLSHLILCKLYQSLLLIFPTFS